MTVSTIEDLIDIDDILEGTDILEDACEEGAAWLRDHRFLTRQGAWDACPRGDWLLWFCWYAVGDLGDLAPAESKLLLTAARLCLKAGVEMCDEVGAVVDEDVRRALAIAAENDPSTWGDLGRDIARRHADAVHGLIEPATELMWSDALFVDSVSYKTAKVMEQVGKLDEWGHTTADIVRALIPIVPEVPL